MYPSSMLQDNDARVVEDSYKLSYEIGVHGDCGTWRSAPKFGVHGEVCLNLGCVKPIVDGTLLVVASIVAGLFLLDCSKVSFNSGHEGRQAAC